jgi:hypothetical protein
MVNGLITLSGSHAELLQRPEIRAAYLEGGRRIWRMAYDADRFYGSSRCNCGSQRGCNGGSCAGRKRRRSWAAPPNAKWASTCTGAMAMIIQVVSQWISMTTAPPRPKQSNPPVRISVSTAR